jgi:exodeoxyribonuclease V gamma subunit
VFSQQSLRFAPVEHTQATVWLLAWLAVWQQASVQPWVLPPELVLDSTNGLKRSPKTAELTYKADKLLEAWQGEGYQTFNPRESRSCVLHPDWQLILQGQDSGTPFLHHLEQHALRLYAPLVEHLETCE